MKRFMTLLAFIVLMGSLWIHAQTVKITGTVTSSEDGEVLPGVTIVLKDTKIGTSTNFDGKYSINVPVGATTLVISSVGHKTQEVEISGRTQIDLELEYNIYSLEELVVVGYGLQPKREVTGSISQVRGDEISSLATPSFEAQLAGRAAGVQITTSTGVLGVAPRIRIRGTGSISSGTYPLVVVDGTPIFTGDLGGWADNNSLGDINPSDIQSIEILKDGSATAIYGSRAANGVILITTKRGSAGKFQLTYNNYMGVAQPVNLFDLLNAEECILINNEKRANRGQSAIAFADGDAGPAVDTDWQEAVLRKNAFQQEHNISMSGANDRTNCYFSLGYADQEGVSRPNELRRYTFKSNLEQKVDKWLSVGTNLGFTQSEYFGLNRGTNLLSGNITSSIRQLPNTPIYNKDHPTGYNIDLISPNLVGRYNNAVTIGDNFPNIIYTLDKNKLKTKNNRVIGSAFANAELLPGLDLRTQVNVDVVFSEGFLYYDPFHGDGRSRNGRIENTFQNLTRWVWQNVLSYNHSFVYLHNLGLTLVNEFQKQRINGFFAGGTDLSNNYFQHNLISDSYSNHYSGGSLSENGFISFAGRFNYNYDGKYFIQASLRRDAISSMPEANRYGVFPGGSIGWTISRESFMENLSFISDLKLRASYAETGNSSVGNYPYAGLYGAAKYGDNNGLAFEQMGNDLLQWETSKKLDVGVDAAFLEGKYQLTFDFFQNDQDNLILFVPTPPSFGIPGNGYNANIGSLKNWGYEFSAVANLIRTETFSLSLDGNISFVKNEITYLTGGQEQIFEPHPEGPGSYTITKVGESIRAIYGYDYVGVNEANGNPIYRKIDGRYCL